MPEEAAVQAGDVLRALADLAPSTEQRSPALAVPTEWFRWLPADSVRLFHPFPYLGGPGEGGSRGPTTAQEAAVRSTAIDRRFGERLAAVDQIRPEQRSLRAGWLFVAGRTTTADGRPRRVFHPLVAVPVRVERPPAFGSARLVPAGDAELTELVGDATARARLESQMQFGGGALDGITAAAIDAALLGRLDGLHRFARAAASAAGLPTGRLVPAANSPEALMRSPKLVVAAGVGVYAVHETEATGRAGSLRAWSEASLARPTAFHSIYVSSAPTPAGPPATDDDVDSPYPLTRVQRDAVVRSRHAPVTLVSGAPGTGKSHTVAAIACDALGRGERVLVAAKTDATVDALLDLLERAPGPDPVVFGSNERREALATRLAAGQLEPLGEAAVESARAGFDRTRAERDALRAALLDQLTAEALVAGASDDAEARVVAPGLFDPGADMADAAARLEAATSAATGWWAHRRRRRAERALRARARSGPDVALDELAAALGVARAARIASELIARGGLEIGEAWEHLRAREGRVRTAAGRWLAAESRSDRRLNGSTLPAVAALATGLRSGRAARREQLSRLDDQKLTRALPLWVGALPDIDDLLPRVAALFDLVVLDEASSIDQPLAAPALLRARRAVVVGDPRQLRHVSFLADRQLRTAIDDHGLSAFPLVAARLDVRRNSAFDVAAGVAPVLRLDEHFRSDPHLVEFVARRLYDGEVKVATRSPRTESKDCVKVVRLQGERDDAGVVRVEVQRVVQELTELRRSEARSVGVVTPFRAQADALEEAVLGAFSADDLEALDLRVGTVHAFQGNERDVVIVSLGIGGGDGGTTWRFVEDPHLFAVLATRARRQMTVLISAEPPARGLVADYLAQADSPPGRPSSREPRTPWAASIAEDLRAAGLSVLTSYVSGRHEVDVCIADGWNDVALECGVHPEGAEAHVERHLALRDAGWVILEAHPSRWSHRRGELVVDVLGRLSPP